ncbi:MAG: efflux RND transporter periplasmic adaptor subunit [Fimbriimonadales bacterium]
MKQLWTLAVCAGLGGFLAGCGSGGDPAPAHVEEAPHEEPGHAEDITLTAEAAKIAGIEIEQARRMPMQAELSVPGVVTNTAHGKAVVTPPVAGKVKRLLVRMGDQVRAGQPIATLQSSELAEAFAHIIEAQRDLATSQAAVREALAELNLSRGQLRATRVSLDRQRQFASTGAFSQPGVQQAEKDLNEAETELEGTLQEQVLHQAQLERAERLFRQELISRSELEEARLEAQKDKLRQEKAKRQIQIARSAFRREKTIAQRGLMNSKEIQTADAEVRAANLGVEQSKIRHRSAQAAVRGAQQGLQAARVSYDALSGGSRASGGTVTVTAPIGGTVTDFEATLGQALERTSEICHIENLRTVWVTASVPDKEIGKARKGATAQVAVKAFPNRIFVGVVQVVGSRLDPKTRTMPVQVLVDNPAGSLRADMFAAVSLGVGRTDFVIAVRRSAIVQEGDARSVFIAEEGGKYEEKVVELGRTKGDYVEILSGLDEGAKAVVKGAFVLKSEKIKSELKGHGH